MVYEILVDGEAILSFSKLHPCRLNVRRTVTFLQKDDIRYDFGARVGFERIVGQTNCAQQVGTLRHILAGSTVFTVHRETAGYKGNHAARSDLVDSLGEKVVVDTKTQLVVRLVADFVLTKRHVSNSQIIKISAVSSFKAGNGDISLWIQLLCNAASNRIQFYAIQTAAGHAVGQHTEEVAHAHGRLQNISRLEAHLFHSIIDGANYHRRGIMGIQRGSAGGGILIFGEQSFQLGILGRPVFFAGVKGIGQTTPANILRKHLLLLGGGTTMLLLQSAQGLDGFNIAGKFLLGTTDTQIIIRDVEIPGSFQHRFSVQGFVCGSSIRECLPFAVDLPRDRQLVQ